MPHDPRKYLEDVRIAAETILDYVRGRTLDEYLTDRMLKDAVERRFEIIGEMLVQLGKLDRATLECITDHQRIIAFRNHLIHRYFGIDNQTVWDIANVHLAVTLREVVALLAELDALLGLIATSARE